MGDKRFSWYPVTILTAAAALGIVLYFYLADSPAPSTQDRANIAYLDMSTASKGLYLAAWTDQRNGNNDIVGALIKPAETTVKSNFPLTAAGGGQSQPAVAANTKDKQFLVVWQDQRNGAFRDIYGQRANHDGSLAGKNFAISVALNDQTDAAVAYGATKNHFLVVWQDYRNNSADIYGQFVSHDGTLVGSNFAITKHPANSSEAAVDYNPSDDEFLIVWEDDRSRTAGDFNVYGQRIGSDGKPSGSELTISAAASAQMHPEVAYSASSKTYLVAWQDLRKSGIANADVYGQRIKNTGSVDGANFAISTASGYQGGRIGVATEKQNFLVTFDDTRNLSTTKEDIYGQRVSSTGSLPGGNFAIGDRKDAQSRSSLAYAGTDGSYLVVWSDWRNVASTGLDIYGQHVASDGSLIDTASDVNFAVSVPKVTGKLKP